jgi:hypothetical protein
MRQKELKKRKNAKKHSEELSRRHLMAKYHRKLEQAASSKETLLQM